MLDWLRRADPRAATQQTSLARKTPAPRQIIVAGRTLPLVIARRANARQISLRLAPDGSAVRVTIPRWGRIAEAEAFARSKTDWLAGHLAALPERAVPGPGGSVPYRGASLRIDWTPAAPRRPAVIEGTVRLGGLEDSVSARLQRWLEAEARRVFTEDLAHYAARAGVGLPRLALSRAQRRWGSCSASGTIRLNWRLVMAPDAVRRAVVAHEVAHLAHFDHSPAFHAHLAALFDGDLATANGWLKREGRSLYAPFG